MGNFPEVLSFNWLFLKLNRFICNLQPVLSHSLLICRLAQSEHKVLLSLLRKISYYHSVLPDYISGKLSDVTTTNRVCV